MENAISESWTEKFACQASTITIIFKAITHHKNIGRLHEGEWPTQGSSRFPPKEFGKYNDK